MRRTAEVLLPQHPRRLASWFGDDVSALVGLAGYRLRAGTRQRLRRLATVRGALAAIAILVVVWFVAVSLYGPLSAGLSDGIPAGVRDSSYLSLALLASVLLSVMTSRGSGVHFGSAEMNILFSAPVRRSRLVLYRYSTYLFGALLSAVLLALILPISEPGRFRLFIATMLTLAFVQFATALLCSVILVARRRWPGLSAGWVIRGAVALLLIVALTIVLRYGLSETLLKIKDSTVLGGVLVPFDIVGSLYRPDLAGSSFVLRALTVAGMLLAILVIIVRLDAILQDEVSAASRAAHARWQSMLGSGSVWGGSIGALRSRRPPVHPYGVAAIAWSESLKLYRTASSMLFWLFVMALLGGAAVAATASSISPSSVAALLFFAFAFLLPRLAVYDFRGSPAKIELLQTLPVRSWVVCLGMLATPVLLAVSLQFAMLAGAAPFIDATFRPWLLVVVLVVVPLTVLQYALENIVFLLFPTRLVPVGRVDFDFLGRTLLEFFAKSVVLAAAVVLAALAGYVAFFHVAPRPIPAGLVVLITLCLSALAAIGVLGLVYRRFDSSRIPQG